MFPGPIPCLRGGPFSRYGVCADHRDSRESSKRGCSTSCSARASRAGGGVPAPGAPLTRARGRAPPPPRRALWGVDDRWWIEHPRPREGSPPGAPGPHGAPGEWASAGRGPEGGSAARRTLPRAHQPPGSSGVQAPGRGRSAGLGLSMTREHCVGGRESPGREPLPGGAANVRGNLRFHGEEEAVPGACSRSDSGREAASDPACGPGARRVPQGSGSAGYRHGPGSWRGGAGRGR